MGTQTSDRAKKKPGKGGRGYIGGSDEIDWEDGWIEGDGGSAG